MAFHLPNYGVGMTTEEITSYATYNACIHYSRFQNFGWEDMYKKSMIKVMKAISVCKNASRLYILIQLDLRDNNLIEAVSELAVESLPRCPRAITVTDTLKDIIPDADPIFLELAGELFVYDDEGLIEFIDLLTTGKKSYPKLAAFNERMKTVTMIRDLTLDFNVGLFVAMCPNPVEFVEQLKSSSNPRFNEDKLQYLFDRFTDISLTTIRGGFSVSESDLTNSIDTLESDPDPVYLKKKRKSWPSGHIAFLGETDNIGLLKEIAFLENKEAVLFHIETEKLIRTIQIKEARTRKTLKNCECCFDTELLTSEVDCCPKGHYFCLPCIKKFVEIQISENNLELKCLTDCTEHLSMNTVKKTVDDKLYQRIMRLKQIKDIRDANIEGLEVCAFCDYSVILSPDIKIIDCLNPECRKQTCRSCREESHVPYRCDEIERAPEVEIRTMIENKMSEVLIRTCPNCNNKFLKEDGCNRMTCNCGVQICYICRNIVDSHYAHFSHEHLMCNKCPLYSDENIIHVAAVEAAARLIINELKEKKPELLKKVDLNKLLPAHQHKRPRPGDPGTSVSIDNEVIAKIIGESVENVNNLTDMRSFQPPPKRRRH